MTEAELNDRTIHLVTEFRLGIEKLEAEAGRSTGLLEVMIRGLAETAKILFGPDTEVIITPIED
ncbi:hypothetical protein [Rufibacter tibetensis]|uniref:Uncharacterized protein n=1 Tax=Rufibacter tibetensis TaxID=512763 RepID=A0A0P0CUF1_9BACT|nr:hypothetical protein [Rufibacter tibetensis]ALI98921.1 hypothetical protein DC20_07935 [Rufibacter tibetensis]